MLADMISPYFEFVLQYGRIIGLIGAILWIFLLSILYRHFHNPIISLMVIATAINIIAWLLLYAPKLTSNFYLFQKYRFMLIGVSLQGLGTTINTIAIALGINYSIKALKRRRKL